jgi:hypothetical protein
MGTGVPELQHEEIIPAVARLKGEREEEAGVGYH